MFLELNQGHYLNLGQNLSFVVGHDIMQISRNTNLKPLVTKDLDSFLLSVDEVQNSSTDNNETGAWPTHWWPYGAQGDKYSICSNTGVYNLLVQRFLEPD